MRCDQPIEACSLERQPAVDASRMIVEWQDLDDMQQAFQLLHSLCPAAL